MPEHFQSRTDMINWLITNCPRPSIVRALKANRVEFLGGFTKIPPSNLPGWIFKVRLSSGCKYVCILCNDLEHKYEIRLVRCVPWESWSGAKRFLYRFETLLVGGDKPSVYYKLWELKNAEKSARQTKNQ